MMNTSMFLRRLSRLLIVGAVIAGATASVAGAVGRPPDVSDAATANATVPDVFERYAADHPYGTGVSPPQQVGVPFYTPERFAAHFNHEDLLYTPRPSLPATPAGSLSQGFDWSDWAIGLGSGIALILALGGALAVARQWLHRPQTT
jgi:hypothetical protein